MAGLMETQDLWNQVLWELQQRTEPATYNLWLRDTRILDGSNTHTWIIGVQHAYALDWLNHRLMPLIQSTVERVAGRPVIIQFAIERQTPEPKADEEETAPGDDDEIIMEAGQDSRVIIKTNGEALVWTDYYVKFKVAFRRRALRMLRGAKLGVFLCLALHVDRDGISSPGVETIMEETGYGSRGTVCSALDDLVTLRLVEKLPPDRWGKDRYRVMGYAWFGTAPAPALFEMEDSPRS